MKKTKQKNTPPQPGRQPSKCACTNVRRAARAITKFYDAAMEPSGLKITQFAMLRNIMVSGPLSASELAQILKLDRTTLVRNLKALQDETYIEGVAGADSRARPIAITQRGRNALEAALPYWEKAQTTIKARLGADNLDTFISLLMDIEALAD